MPKWMQLLAREAEGPTGGGAPTPPSPASGEPPAQNPPAAGGEGSPTPAAEGEPAANGSLVPEGDKPVEGEPPKAPEPAVEPIDPAKLTLPEGMKADDPGLVKLAGVLNNKDLKPQERAQALVEAHREAAKSIAETAAAAVSDNYRKINEAWVAEVKSDPVLGGDKMQESLGVVAKALDTWGDGKALRRDLALTGMGNNPHFLRFVHKMATELGEGRPAHGGTPGPGRKPMAEIMYGKAPEAGA